MGILDKITGKPAAPKKEDKKKLSKKSENVLDMVKEEKPKDQEPVKLKEDTKHAHRVLLTYHLSEKTNSFANNGSYVFKVAKTANKIEIRKAIESVYDVHVVYVNVLNIKGKNRRTGRTMGQTSDWKKAIVKLKTGEKITGLAEGV